MRILILGAGALGGLVGAQLTRAGEDVTLLEVNTARGRLLRDDGLLISRVGEAEACIPLHVVSSVEGLAAFDLVFVAVKTYETEDAVRAVLGACSPDTLFLTLQNGIGNAETLASLVDAHHVLCGITYHSIQHAGPRRLQYREGIKPIQIAPFVGESTPAIATIAEVFRRAGLNTEVAPNVEHAVWQKALHNAVVNPTSALTGLTCREMLADPDLIAFMRDLAAEIVHVMRAKGIPIVDEEDPFRPVLGSLRALGKNRPSMWQDLTRGKRTEIDALNGAIAATAERLGMAAPHNAAITHFIHSRERQSFLNKERIAQQLGIIEHRASDGAPAAAGGSAPLARRPRAGASDAAPALESTRKLKELVRAYYVDVAAAAADHRRLVAACSALAPVEILRALDIVPYFPEHHATLISATGQSRRYLARAASEGFSQFASSAMRVDIGALLEQSTPLTVTHGIAEAPRPKMTLFSTNAGGDLQRWFEMYGSHYDIAGFGIQFPPGLSALDRVDIDAASDQVLRVVERIETATRRTLEISRLADVVRQSTEAAALWRRILDLAQMTPSPLTFFDTLVHLAPMVLLRGTPDAVAYYRLLASELEERVAAGVGAVPGERHRFYWHGPPIWCAHHILADIFARRGVAVVASTYASTFALTDLDGDDPVESLARAYAGIFDNRSEAFKASALASSFTAYGVDACVYHDCRTSADASGIRYGIGSRVERLTGAPALVVEADAHDPRLFSAERLERQLADFVEQHAELFADRLVAY